SLLTAAAAGLDGSAPNVYLEPIKTLDVTVSQRLGKGFTLAFKARNLQPQSVESIYRTPAGQEAVKTERESARLLGVALSWSW
ncbi:MAG: hypothetical protein L0170_10130, partial [Acidobacteria bacterium]|nr:hypothetical protein [Acidobacteriota bacterium]